MERKKRVGYLAIRQRIGTFASETAAYKKGEPIPEIIPSSNTLFHIERLKFKNLKLSDMKQPPLESASGNTFRVILLPQPVTPGTPWIEITVGGRTVTYAVPAGLTELEGGKEQVVNLKLTNSGAN
ncbi:fimbrillin family protein [Bacteroides sp. RTP21281st1_E4_RTP21281_210402]|uniref:fimbrillin family protein n=1 Tax=unclassified Bacteroides TaxID=2646097 RepID=UPI0034A37199